ncbi:MAG: methyltransferase domain-containing protein [Candidatus Methanoperedens sp.]
MGENVEYNQCKTCGLIVVNESKKYDLSKIYNDNYFRNVDTGWKDRANLVLKLINIINRFINLKEKQMCDYGAGNGYLTKSLIDLGYRILAYEPFMQNNLYLDKKYYKNKPFPSEVLLLIEVFEHFTNAFNEIKKLLDDFKYPKFIIFTTFLVNNSDKNIVNWWYLNPDAGHFTLWSKKSLKILGNLEGYKLISFTTFFHIFCKKELHKEYIIIKMLSVPFNLYVSLKKQVQQI